MTKINFGEGLTFLKKMDGGIVDLFVQDLPYGVTRNEWDKKVDLKEFWAEWLRVGKEDCVFVFFAQQPFTTELINSNPNLFKYDIVWEKKGRVGGFLNAKKMPLRSHETILVFYRKRGTYNPQMVVGEKNHTVGKSVGEPSKSSTWGKFNVVDTDLGRMKYPKSVIAMKAVRKTKHTTEKPVDLLRWIIRTYSNQGELVFDGFAGSGSTGEAAFWEDRRCILCEKNRSFYDKCVERISKIEIQQKLFI